MKSLACVLIVLSLCACGDDGPSGPYDSLPVDERITGTDVDAPVDVVRDRYGVAHVRASSVGDLAFAQGYVMASDRIQQMDLFRHFASGRISELFGALDPAQIDGDLEMRIHRFEATAQATWEELDASSDPEDVELALFLQRFADGVNRYVADLVDGTRQIDPEIRPFFDPARMRPWTPADSLVIGRLQAMSLSYSDAELTETDMRERAVAGFDDAVIGTDLARRTGAYQDLVRIAPADPTATRAGFPTAAARVRPPGARPQVPLELLARAQTVRNRLFDTRNGSNNWVVGPDLAGGKTLMANDPHLTLASPSIFYAMHLTIPGDVDVAGITFPGIPGIILGHNEHIAWGATTVNHDVTDFYLEDVAPCAQGSGDCVTFEGGQVPIETWEETLDIGALGTITESRTVSFERVPHHGPILPTIVDHDTAPRPAGPAISVRYTGHEPTYELAAFRGLWRATTADEGMAAMQSFGFGAQNWVFTDDTGHIGWTTNALVPWRTEGCFTWDPTTGDGVAPWWVVPGDGSCEWDGWIESEHLPQDYDPAQGFLATANQDPVGATFDGDPTNTIVDGKVLYVGARDYDEGYRVGRITRRIEALAESGAATAEDMTSIQADAYSNLGAALRPAIVTAIDRLEAELSTPGTYADLADFAAGLTAAQRTRLAEGRAVLEAWSFDAAVDGDDGAATVLFNVWLVDFLDKAFGDEASVVGRGAGGWLTNTVVAVLTTPEVLRTGLASETGEPLLCDDLATPGPEIESCSLMIVRAFDAALGWIATGSGLGADPSGWRWGDLHRLTLEPLIPLDSLKVADGDAGFARHGDNHSVDASSPGMDDLEFSYDHGPAMRHVTVLGGGEGPRTLLAIPGGQIMDTASPHWRDLMDEYWSVNEYFEVPWTVDQVIEHHEARWRFE